jgi:hypothetical protein
MANAAIGVPQAIEPRALGKGLLIFSLPGLEAHLRQAAPEIIAEYDRAGGLQTFVDSREASAFEYLVTGLIECILWCVTHNAALCIRW